MLESSLASHENVEINGGSFVMNEKYSLIVAVVNTFLQKNGREDYTNLVSLAGIIIAAVVLVTKLGELIELISSVFNVL